MKTFSSLGLSAELLAALDRAGYTEPTPIQAKAIPPALEGRNVIGCAATGTGKTAAFILPLIERAVGRKGTTALVLAPTRELAVQIAEYVDTFGPARRVKAAVVVGGLGMGPQTAALRARPALIIATPGRLVDHIDQGNADLSGVQALVLDEADRMLDMGFRPQLERIFRKLPQKRQTLLFSATMAGEVADFARRYVTDPVQIEIHRSGTTAARAEQRLYRTSRNEKQALLLSLLHRDDESTLVFVRTKHRADKIYRFLDKQGISATRLHGDRSQSQRRHSLEGFRSGEYRVLVATDVAARGIDVEAIGHVINFDLPNEAEDYVHRIGRTARNEASGRASSFAEPDDAQALRGIERLIGSRIPEGQVPREDPIFVAEMERRQAAERHPGAHGGRTHGQLAAAGKRPPARKKPASATAAAGERPARQRTGQRPAAAGGRPGGQRARPGSGRPQGQAAPARGQRTRAAGRGR